MGFVVNFVIGAVLLVLGLSILNDTLTGDRVVAGVTRRFRAMFGPDFQIHPLVIASALLVFGLLFLGVAFAIYAKWHDFWVLSWL